LLSCSSGKLQFGELASVRAPHLFALCGSAHNSMAGYIRIDKDQVADQRLFDVADELAEHWRISHGTDDLSPNDFRHALRNALLGALVTLWAYADTHIRSDDALRVTLEGLAPIVGLPVEILEVLPEDWLQVNEEGCVVLPGYCEKNNIRARDLRKQDLSEKRQRELQQGAERQRRHREKRLGKRNGRVTQKSSRDRNGVTHPTGTGTGPLDPTGTVPESAAPRAAGRGAAAAPRQSFDEDFTQRFGRPPVSAKSKP
jgi:hypothetical protein